ncbi:acyl-CoA dehydrogenase family protein [Gordonia sp. NPDC058843]|uniref:acyl-CoA dehydrogenase family protein n=1 Tax=Gordonia sp. NPDC058843 TaxID=3346648 RepID=UPI0036C58A76
MILDDVEAVADRTDFAEVLAGVTHRATPRNEVVARADAAAAGRLDSALWERLVGEVGVLGLAVPEELDGAGATWAEIAVLMEQIGRSTAAVPALGAILAVEAVTASGDVAARAELLPSLLAGTVIGTVWTGTGLTADAEGRVSGEARLVVEGGHADVVIAQAETDAGSAWFAIETAGASVRRHEALDLVRDLATITFTDAPARVITVDVPDSLSNRLRDLALVAVAAEQLGVAEQALADSVEYASVREQFRRVIGSFQALKHLIADVATETDLARSLVEHAVWAAVASPEDLPEAAAMAMLAASRAAIVASGENVQVHGGIGFSWEHHAHLLFRKARSNDFLLGPPDRLADRILSTHGVHR